jgi:hypothetical protein
LEVGSGAGWGDYEAERVEKDGEIDGTRLLNFIMTCADGLLRRLEKKFSPRIE